MSLALEQTKTWVWRYDACDLKKSNLIPELVDSIVVECDVAAARRTDLELVLAEVVNNAIDHGVLQLDSALKKNPQGFEQYFINRVTKLANLEFGQVVVSIEQLNQHLISLCVQDSGAGFDFPRFDMSLQPLWPRGAYGRGLLIVRHLCESMVHLGCGNCILLEFKTTAD